MKRRLMESLLAEVRILSVASKFVNKNTIKRAKFETPKPGELKPYPHNTGIRWPEPSRGTSYFKSTEP